MGSSTPATQTVTNRTEVDPVTAQWRNAIFTQGNDLLNQGPAPYYPGSTVVPYADQTTQGLDMIQANAQGGAVGLPEAYDASMRAMSGNNPAMAYADQFAQGTSSGQQAMQSFMPGASNPYLDQMWESGKSKVSDAVNAQFAGSGRFGANAAYGGALTSGLGDLYTGIYAPAYENERNRQMQAASTLLSSQMSGADLLGGLYSQGNADAARAQALLPSLYAYGEMPGQSMVGVGGAYEALSREYLDADINRWNYDQNAEWDNLSRYASMMNGLPDFSSTTQTSTGGQGTNRAMGALGGAAAGAQLGSMLGPWGTGIGAILGGGAGLFG